MKSADNKKKNAKNIKDNNGSTGSPESYSLYTENIVEKPSVRYHKLIRFAELVCCAVVFGIVAAVVFVVVYEKIESSDKPGSSAERIFVAMPSVSKRRVPCQSKSSRRFGSTYSPPSGAKPCNTACEGIAVSAAFRVL